MVGQSRVRLSVPREQQPDGKAAGALDDQRTRVASVAERMVVQPLDDNLAAEQDLPERRLVRDLDISVDARDASHAVACGSPHLVHDHVDCGRLGALREADANDVPVRYGQRIELCDGTVDAVGARRLEGDEPREGGDLIGGRFPAVQQPGLEDGTSWRELILVGQDVVVAEDVRTGRISDQAPERPCHHEGVIRVGEADG